MTRVSLLFLTVFFCSAYAATAQTYKISGNVADTSDKSAVIGAYLKLTPAQDSARAVFTSSDREGRFHFTDVAPGKYDLTVTNLTYATLSRQLLITDKDLNLGTLSMKEGARLLREVQVVGQIQQSQQKGDTTQFNAAAFKVNPDATTEELIQKMPGINVVNGQVQAQGENVQRVLVDGKPFFGDDPTLALRNLPAEVVDKIEVFDRQSDQAQFSGFDDGNAQKTINIVTRADRNRGQFGKLFAGYGADNRYMAGGNINFFEKGQRFSVIGLSNNVNQQNFGAQDLAGVLGNSGGSRGGGRGGNSGNFMVGQQSGITNTSAFGLNYTGTWSPKTEVTGSYFFNRAGNSNHQITGRESFLANGNQLYNDTSTTASTNYNHRINLRIEHKLNDRNSFILTPGLSFQNNENSTLRSGATRLADDTPINLTQSNKLTHTNAYNFNNNLLWRHRFAKPGRTFSVDFTTAINRRESNGSLKSRNNYFTSIANPGDTIDQLSESRTRGIRLAANANYTEPLGKNGQLQAGYNFSVSNNNSKSETNHFSEVDEAYTRLDSLLSNTFENRYLTQRAGVSYRIRNKTGLQFAAGFDLQSAGLYSQQRFPGTNKVDNTFFNLLPNAMLMYRGTGENKSSLRIFYRSSTNEPSINQLQNVVDNSNPLFMTAGNPDLKQSYTHRLNVRYNRSGAATGHNLFAMISGNIIQNTITNSTFIAQEPTLLPNGLLLERGAQLTSPVNVNGNWDLRGFVTYGMPVKPLKLNVNLNSGVNYQHMPGLINLTRNLSNTYTFSQGVVVSSNISTKIDFTLSYNGNYNIVRNSIRKQSDNTYYSQNLGGRINWLFGKGFLLQTDLGSQSYRGLSEGFNQRFTLWNASFGKKVFKNNSGEFKVSVFDILGQNNSISRSVTESYQQDVISQVLTRYVMFTFTYNLRNFGSRSNKNPSYYENPERNDPTERFPGERLPGERFPRGGENFQGAGGRRPGN